MGKMFDALRKAESKPRPALGDGPALRTFQPEFEVDTEPEADETIPFVEVGGPRPMVEAGEIADCGLRIADSPKPQSAIRDPQSPGPLPARISFRPLGIPGSDAGSLVRAVAPELIAFHQPDHPLSKEYRSLFHGLAQQLPAARAQVLLFTATTRGAGTTTVLLNLAITAARQGKLRVAVVDANSGRPAVAERLGLSATPGLGEVLSETLPLPWALRDTAQPNLRALTGGEPIPNGTLPFASPHAQQVFRQLRDRFDLVLVDGPAWIEELAPLGALCDGLYLVLAAEESENPAVNELAQVLAQQGCQPRGCIFHQQGVRQS